MAVPFLKQVADHLLTQYKDTLESCCVVLPNKRAALFLKNHLANHAGTTLWLPKILGAEEFFAELSGLTVLEDIDLVCHLYESYRACYGENAEGFDAFSKWAQLILQDFNEIDRYLANPEQLYENLRNIKDIENWSLGEETLTAQQQEYLAFMAVMGRIYTHFNRQLRNKKQAYQGLVYREAVQCFETAELLNEHGTFIFCGFNAMNAAEQKIIHALYLRGKAELLWDTDLYYMSDIEQEAGMFLRRLVQLMPDARTNGAENNFNSAKRIHVVSVPKQMGQAMVVKQKVQSFLDEGASPDQIAVVLANEKLLWPVLQQLPDSIQQVNITMEYPIRYTTAYSLLDSLIQVQASLSRRPKGKTAVYYQDFVQVLKEPLFLRYLELQAGAVDVEHLLFQIRQRNISFLSQVVLNEFFGEAYAAVKVFFEPCTDFIAYTSHLSELLLAVYEGLSSKLSKSTNRLELEFIQLILQQFTRLQELLGQYPYFNQLNTYRHLFHQVIGSATAPFSGEPLSGLQIMGLLESRTLDFDYLVMVGVNEGVLPSGKSVHSFLPNDLKRAFGLPLYTEKDAIYAYHFYRLLQRAKNVCITYDSETDTFGKGEKSRFVTQLELELPLYSKQVELKEEIAAYAQMPKEPLVNISLNKSDEVLSRLFEKAVSNEEYKGLSPSSLIAFKECSLRFYFRYAAGLKESEEVEESAENNTMGSILHLSLETLYRDSCGEALNKATIAAKHKMLAGVVRNSFISFFDNTEPSGKSLLQEEVIKVYVNKQLKQDLNTLEQLGLAKKELRLLHLEHELSAKLQMHNSNGLTEVYIKGTADRIDLCGEALRIIDYKSSVKTSDKFEFTSFDNLFSNSQYNKQLQLFLYAWLAYKNKLAEARLIQPCIIAFKHYYEEPEYLTRNGEALVFSDAFFGEFETALTEFVSGIFDRVTPFRQTENTELCEYCAYNRICNRP